MANEAAILVIAPALVLKAPREELKGVTSFAPSPVVDRISGVATENILPLDDPLMTLGESGLVKPPLVRSLNNGT